ncbi:MAG TPA: helix-turn-helix domain-containing protein, partial [Lentisphaeria bacterium]|nr:helix-turn-helix domain-containing protein [Lentisphaeria bacterium]
VADYYDIRIADMTSKRRPANIAFPRQVAMFLARKLTDLSLTTIAEHFNRNHATVIHAIDAVNERQTNNQDFQREVALIERKLKNL